MLLSMRAHGNAVGYKNYRFPNVDGDIEFDGMDFREKFNKALNMLREQMEEDRSTDPSLHIVDVWIS